MEKQMMNKNYSKSFLKICLFYKKLYIHYKPQVLTKQLYNPLGTM